jgi:hypothetical protein
MQTRDDPGDRQEQGAGIAHPLQEPLMAAVRQTFKNAVPMVTRNVDVAVLFANRGVALTKGRVYSAGRDQVLEARRAQQAAEARDGVLPLR